MKIKYNKFKASIENYLSAKQCTQQQLAKRSGVQQSTLSQYRQGKRNPSLDSMTKISSAIGVPFVEFIEWEVADNMRMAAPPYYVPLISWTHAGKFSDKIDNNCVGVGEPVPYFGNDHNAFALIVEGDSMEDEFFAGDRIIVSPSAYVTSGDYCIVELHGEAALKKIIMYDHHVILKALNKKYDDIIVEETEKSFRVLGKVVEKSKKY